MGSTAITVQERAVVAQYSPEQKQLLIDTIAKGCDDNEFKLFIEIAKLSRLNPFTGQIRPVKRWNSDLGRQAMVVQVGIDGYRAIASRTTELAGIDDAIFDSEEEDHPLWAKVTVYRWSHGERVPYPATARWSEYVQKKKDGEPNSMWSRMPYLMLAKCAEALALRKAFPDELTGVYTDEEMGQADNPEPKPLRPAVTQPRRASEKQAEQPKTEERKDEGPEPVIVSGKIESTKVSAKGSLWLTIAGKIVVIDQDRIDDSMTVGSVLTVKGYLKNHKDVGDYIGVTAILENPEAVEPEKSVPTMDELKASGAVTTAAEIENKPKTIGTKRAQRLYIMMNNNKESGLTEKILKERILSQMEPPLEHLSDLPKDLEPMFEKLMTGEEDWRKHAAEE